MVPYKHHSWHWGPVEAQASLSSRNWFTQPLPSKVPGAGAILGWSFKPTLTLLFGTSASSYPRAKPTFYCSRGSGRLLHFCYTSHSRICTHPPPWFGLHGLEYHLECSGVPSPPLRLMVCPDQAQPQGAIPFLPSLSVSQAFTPCYTQFPFIARPQPLNMPSDDSISEMLSGFRGLIS